MIKPKVGEKYKCVAEDWACDVGETMSIEYVGYTCADYITEKGLKGRWGFTTYPNDFQLVEEKVQQMDLTKKTFINVQKYADMYNLTLEEANNEIQPWLFEQGIHHAYPSYKGKVVFTEREIVEVSMDKPLAITSCHMDVFCKESYEQELTLSRKVVLTPSTSNLVEYVTINGKQYNKRKLEEALKLLED